MWTNIALVSIYIASILSIRISVGAEEKRKIASYFWLHLFLNVALLLVGMNKSEDMNMMLVIIFIASILLVLASLFASDDAKSISYNKYHLVLDALILITGLAK